MTRDTKKPQRHHVFLFRHCVRSTKSDTKLFYDSKDIEDQVHIRDYIKSPLPNWNVPKDWCLPLGMKIVERSGEYIMRNIILGDMIDENKKNPDEKIIIKFDILSDTAHRDIDTSVLLSNGMYRVAEEFYESIETIDLEAVRSDHHLFFPFTTMKNQHALSKEDASSLRLQQILSDQNRSSNETQSLNHINSSNRHASCIPEFSNSQRKSNVLDRLKVVAKPELSLQEALELLQNLGGIGPKGPFTSILGPLKSLDDLSLGHAVGEFQGPINILVLCAQMMLFSRAGGITPVFLPNATVDDVYKLLAWANYRRSVLSIDNDKHAVRGSFFANAIINGLKYKRKDHQQNNLKANADLRVDYGYDEYDIKVTILVGHDTDIDSAATAMGLRWKLDPPFYHHEQHVVSPPGSAMHFVHDLNSGDVRMSYLYPIILHGNGKKYRTNKTGTLESTPMTFFPDLKKSENHSFSTNDDVSILSVTAIGNKLNGVDLLNRRIISNLKRYRNAVECYTNLTLSREQAETPNYFTVNVPATENIVIANTGDSFLSMISVISIILVILGFLFVLSKPKSVRNYMYNGLSMDKKKSDEEKYKWLDVIQQRPSPVPAEPEGMIQLL